MGVVAGHLVLLAEEEVVEADPGDLAVVLVGLSLLLAWLVSASGPYAVVTP